MALSPIYVGDLRPAMSFTWVDDNGTPVNLTGATLGVSFRPSSGSAFAGTGTFTIVNANTGQFTYQQSAADVAAAFSGTLRFTATYAGSSLLTGDAIPFAISA